MAFAFRGQVDPENEARMRGYYETLSEKDGRRFAVLQARLLQACWDVRPRRLNAPRMNSMVFPMILRRDGFGLSAAVEKKSNPKRSLS